MYRIYLKQAIEMLKQNKFISMIAIIGTALAIMMIMVIVLVYSIKNESIAPEVNRYRTLYLKYQKKEGTDKSNWRNSQITYDVYKNYMSGLVTPESVSAICIDKEDGYVLVSGEAHPQRMLFNKRLVDANYWKIMSFSFLAGKPFTYEEFLAGMPRVVITESTAKELFGSVNLAFWKNIEIDFNEYLICGVVKDVSPVFDYAYADVYIPYTAWNDYAHFGYNVLLLMREPEDINTVEREIRDIERKYNLTDAEWKLSLYGPYNHRVQQINTTVEEPDVNRNNNRMISIILILLLIPAINLSSISYSRIKKRTDEIGIRKVFGARKSSILMQILCENLLVTLTGGFLGLLLSYFVLIQLKKWLLGIDASMAIPIETLVSIPVFVSIFMICLLLNMLSAVIPAYKASRMQIVDSINKKEA